MAFNNALKDLDLTNVVAIVQENLGLSDADTERAEELYRQYLTLCHKYPDMQVVPPKLVDEVWHAHIMNTPKYTADCETLFGSFLHHAPHSLESEGEFENTKELYKKEFLVDLDNYGLSDEMVSKAACGVGA